jgi:hypothetical protein
MFNNWIAQGLGKISAILAWALGSKVPAFTGEERTEILVLYSSLPDMQINLISGLCRISLFTSRIKTDILSDIVTI